MMLDAEARTGSEPVIRRAASLPTLRQSFAKSFIGAFDQFPGKERGRASKKIQRGSLNF
jgi:hypothetical protein